MDEMGEKSKGQEDTKNTPIIECGLTDCIWRDSPICDKTDTYVCTNYNLRKEEIEDIKKLENK